MLGSILGRVLRTRGSADKKAVLLSYRVRLEKDVS